MSNNLPLIGVIICSSRKPRVCPQIADFVIETYGNWILRPALSTSAPPTLKIIDLAEWNLPMFDEPGIPSKILSHEEYFHPHTRAWSIEIQKYTGFIFVTPQYNWGYPAVIKNAIDYLFNEWKGKPAMIVSYGGHGGVKAAAQLNQVLHGVGMKVVENMPSLSFPDKTTLVLAATGRDIGALGNDGIWESEKDGICKALAELVALVAPSEIEKV